MDCETHPSAPSLETSFRHRIAQRLIRYGLIASCLASGLYAATAIGEETAGKAWPESQLMSMDKIDHTAFDELLQKYVDEDGMVDYKAWHASKADRKVLTDYLSHLSQGDTRRKATQEAKLAFWINAYNATTIEGILRVYPTTSIRNHTAKVFGYNIWKNLNLKVGKTEINLDSIEHQVLRKMNEPRIHFAIVCASIGCPRLLNQAYTAEKLEEQLVINSQDFFSRDQNLKLDTRNKKVQLSSIMSWFGEDFGKTHSEQLKSIWPYIPADKQKEIAKGGYSFDYQEYDWNLNAQPEKKKVTKPAASGSGAKTRSGGSAKKGSGKR